MKHLLKREYPGINIGPEPTTDRFVVVMEGMEERRTPGNTLIVQPDKPFQVSLPACSCPPLPAKLSQELLQDHPLHLC